MNIDSPTTEEQIEPLVRAALAADARKVDVARVAVEILARFAAGDHGSAEPATWTPQPAPSTASTGLSFVRRPGARRALRWGFALAACLVAAIGLGEWFTFSATPASAYSLVESAHSVLSKSRDRCYQVEMALPKGWLSKSSFLHADDRKFVWTRGDRFRFSMFKDGEELVWGQDEGRRTWVVSSDDRGLFFEANEVPLTLALTLSYLSLDFERLSAEILENFDLAIEDPTPANGRDIVTVLATAKPAAKSQHFQSARLEIDPTTKVVRKMELSRVVRKNVNAVVTFTLINEDPQSNASYTLEGNLPQGAPVLGKEKARERAKLFNKLLL
jgi:hypothetical protein